jgi:hypothetical protein
MKNNVLFLLIFLPIFACSQEKNAIMTHLLKNQNIEILIDLPLANYNFSRFDWTGKIVSVKYKNIEISGIERIPSEDENKYGKGFYNEFGIQSALGYEEAGIGEWFHKIGVGLLKKDSGDYLFSKTYEIQPASFEVTMHTDKVIFYCKSKSNKGYSYVLKKEIKLTESGFTVLYLLTNTGSITINTNEYSHNFIAINRDRIGIDYILRFPFGIKPELFEGNVNPEGKVNIEKKDITFTGIPKEQFYFGNLSGSEDVVARWELINTKNKIGISEEGSFKTRKVNLWGWEHVISPELFVEICVKPGETMEWSRTYNVFEIN